MRMRPHARLAALPTIVLMLWPSLQPTSAQAPQRPAAPSNVRIIKQVGGDTTPPTVSITAPASGATVSGNVNITATAADNVGVAGVHFDVDGVNLGAEVTSPYQFSWNTRTALNGAHTLTAIARDAAGNVTASSGVNVTVSNTAATVTLSPQDTTL